jgi:hypothetical protein
MTQAMIIKPPTVITREAILSLLLTREINRLSMAVVYRLR